MKRILRGLLTRVGGAKRKENPSLWVSMGSCNGVTGVMSAPVSSEYTAFRHTIHFR